MLEQIEGDPSVFIQGDDLTVEKRVRRQPLASAGYLQELLRKEIFSA
jgi:hypothetical protein